MEEITNGSIGKTIVILVVMLLLGWMPVTAQRSVNYAVVVKNSTYQDPAWAVVVDTLLERYNGLAFTYETSVWEVQTGLVGIIHPMCVS